MGSGLDVNYKNLAQIQLKNSGMKAGGGGYNVCGKSQPFWGGLFIPYYTVKTPADL
jgi:hypothetical protein